MKVKEVFAEMPVSRHHWDGVHTEVKTKNECEYTMKRTLNGGYLQMVRFYKKLEIWHNLHPEELEQEVFDFKHFCTRNLFKNKDEDIAFLSSLMTHTIEFVECAFDKSLAPMLEIGNKYGWQYNNCAMFEGDEEVPFYLFDFESDQKEVEEVFKLILPEGGKIKFEGRKSKKDVEDVTLYLPKSFIKQFSLSHDVVVWGKYLNKTWGKTRVGFTPEVTYQFHPPENGGSIIPAVYHKLVEELGEAMATLEKDRGYEPLTLQ
jgi:hypothetical protein